MAAGALVEKEDAIGRSLRLCPEIKYIESE